MLKRTKLVVNFLLKHPDFGFNHTNLQKVIEHLNSCVDHHRESSRIEHLLCKLESIKSVDPNHMKSVVNSVNMQLEVYLEKIQQYKHSPTLLDISIGLHTIFIDLLDPVVAQSTDAFMQKLLKGSSINFDYSSFKKISAVDDDIDIRKCAFLAERKKQFINELMNVPFIDVLEFLEKQKIPHDEEKLSKLLSEPTQEFKLCLEQLANKVGLELDELTWHLHTKNDIDEIEYYRDELSTYIIGKNSDQTTCTLEDFVRSTPNIPSDILTEAELVKMRRLFNEYCNFVRKHKIQEIPAIPSADSEETTGVTLQKKSAGMKANEQVYDDTMDEKVSLY